MNTKPEWTNFVASCQACHACDLAKTRTNCVVWRGAVPADLLIIGEGPGAEEDRQGKPFVGRSGRLLDDLLLALEIPAEIYHIANIVKCRPPENRQPSEEEAKACRPLLSKQFALVQPKVILLCGATAYKYFTGGKESISTVRGCFLESKGYYILPTFHPAYILRNLSKRQELWDDVLQVRQKLEALQCLPPLRRPGQHE